MEKSPSRLPSRLRSELLLVSASVWEFVSWLYDARRSRSRPGLYARSPRRGFHRHLRIDSAAPDQKSHPMVVPERASLVRGGEHRSQDPAGCRTRRGALDIALGSLRLIPRMGGTTWKGLWHNYNSSGHWLEGCTFLPLRLSHISIRRSTLLLCHDSTSSDLAMASSKWHMQGPIV